MKLQYKMVVSDFDDTLLSDDGTISPRNIEAINAYVKAGGRFVLCTGRMFSSIQSWAQQLGLHGLIACYQGGMAADIDTGEIVRNVQMDNRDVVAQLVELEQYGMYAQLYHNDTLYVESYDEHTMEYERLSGVDAAVTCVPLSEYAAESKVTAHKLMAIDSNQTIRRVQTELEIKYPHLMYVMSKPTFLEVVPKTATKAEGMRYIAARFGIPLSEIIAVGDSMNDLPMIEEAGLGVCVASGAEEVKRRAKVVCAYTNNENAVAHLIEDYAYRR